MSFFSLEWNSECVIDGESGEQVEVGKPSTTPTDIV